jgi:hypothetical protein
MTSQRRRVPFAAGAVQPESRLRFSGEVDARTSALVHQAHLAASQKRGLHATIHNSNASVAEIAEHAGVAYPTLANAALTSSTDQLPFARLGLVLRACDDLTLVRLLADFQNADVIPRPQLGVRGVDDLQRIAATMREFAEFTAAGGPAVGQMVITPELFATIEREGLEAVAVILELVALYRARVQRPLLEGV